MLLRAALILDKSFKGQTSQGNQYFKFRAKIGSSTFLCMTYKNSVIEQLMQLNEGDEFYITDLFPTMYAVGEEQDRVWYTQFNIKDISINGFEEPGRYLPRKAARQKQTNFKAEPYKQIATAPDNPWGVELKDEWEFDPNEKN